MDKLLILISFLLVFLAGCDTGHVLQIAGTFVAPIAALVSLVVGLTKSPKDDAVWGKILPFLSFLQPKDAPGTVKLPLTPHAKPVE